MMVDILKNHLRLQELFKEIDCSNLYDMCLGNKKNVLNINCSNLETC